MVLLQSYYYNPKEFRAGSVQLQGQPRASTIFVGIIDGTLRLKRLLNLSLVIYNCIDKNVFVSIMKYLPSFSKRVDLI